MFYTLSVVSIFFATEDWVADVSMAYVMIYSAISAFHAIIMVSVRHHLQSRVSEPVSIATAGPVEAPQISIWPMIWDEDCDAVLAVVGTAFLIMAPIVIWSNTFHKAFKRPRYQPIFVGWFLLLLVGLISAMVNEVHVDMWTVGQFRFCSTGDLPDLSLSGLSLRGREHPNKSFNESIWDTFSNASTSRRLPPICVYPCFDASWPLRQWSNIKVISSSGTWPSTSNYSNVNAGWGLMFAAIILITASVSIMITIFILKRKNLIAYGDYGILKLRKGLDDKMKQRLRKLDYSAKVLTGVSLLFFVAWIEYTMWPYPYSEKFTDIGQWGQLASTILVLAFAAYKYILPPEIREQEPIPASQHNPALGTNEPIPVRADGAMEQVPPGGIPLQPIPAYNRQEPIVAQDGV
ncbi:hypothetical protein FGG08_003905 [Glutinoglossum americanum]|uniref:Uncharacterized protein n=1 Tax=Glutinoglossum americanum TaxID=1670608 RepID=A0A9P8HXC6_9PEZI|nr:hypothetical protein FGG08_003905 [Glutinoglossum americanum]